MGLLPLGPFSARRFARSPVGLVAAVATALAVLTGCVVAISLSSGASDTRPISQGKPVATSSVQGGDHPAEAAVDGDTRTRWRSQARDPQWLQVDLRERVKVDRVRLAWEANSYASEYQIQISDDTRSWSTVHTATGTAGVQTLSVAGTGRYVRFYGTARATANGYSLWEFQVYGTPLGNGCDRADVARGRPATASSVESSPFPATAAVDGDRRTRWASAWSGPQWLQVDLGGPTAICQVVLEWENAYATGYLIQVSNDAGNWTSVHSTTTGAGGNEVLDVAGTGRYLRVYLRASATRYGYSLWTLQVRAGAGVSRAPDPGASRSGQDRLLSYHKPTEASSSRNDPSCRHCEPADVVDSDPATRWTSADPAGSPGWIHIDLGATADIHEVVVQWAGEYARTYDIQVSADATNWTTVYHAGAGKGLLESLPVGGTGRHVRLYATGGAGADRYSLWEFKVYGTGGAPLAPPAGPPAPKDPPTLVWSDDFNAPAGSRPDPNKWRADTGPGFTGELQYYTDNKSAYQDGTGNLALEARREVTPGSTCPNDPVSNSTTCQYTSARLNTYGAYSFTYGRVEARIKVSGTQGLWPAFWMLGENLYTGRAAWPDCGEIDIMEHVGRSPNQISSTLHAPAYFSNHSIGAPYRVDSDAAAGFHVYAVDWRPDRITFSVDGNDFFTVDKETTEKTRGPWVFDHPFVLVLNNAIGGPFPGQPDARTVLPQRMLVDYVRVYQ
ncbi:MAG TPA: discoidin domain-containing protein [Planosporangium sp.]|nr:discoidin domain-containing protein [Planosporangium sp.]